MSTNSKLEQDWKTHPCLRFYAFSTVDELESHLRGCHETLIGDMGMAYGYLYQKQIERNKKLRKELEKCQQIKNK
jgi:hypothetical protein